MMSLPLFLNSDLVAKTLTLAPSSAYEVMQEKDFPTLHVNRRHGGSERKVHQVGGGAQGAVSAHEKNKASRWMGA
ncbi:MAG: hypothetical protein V8R27_03605, partial [Oscillospiraceae bacterium]